jgi:hypothetical protein
MIKWDSSLGLKVVGSTLHESISIIIMNRKKDKNHTIFSTDVEKAFDKIKNPFLKVDQTRT